LTSVNEASRAGVPRKLRKTLVISLRLQLGANGGVLFDCLLFALIPFNPRFLCHREDRILADKRQISINFYIGARTALVRVPLLPKPNRHHKDARFTLWHGRPSSVFPFRPKPNGTPVLHCGTDGPRPCSPSAPNPTGDARFTLGRGRPSSVFPFRPKPNGRDARFTLLARTSPSATPLSIKAFHSKTA
jgi:hypothetical protein